MCCFHVTIYLFFNPQILMTLVQFFTKKHFCYELHWFFFFFFLLPIDKISPQKKLWFPCLMSMSRLHCQDVNNYLYTDLKHKLQSRLQKNLLALVLTSLPKAQNIETNLHYGAFTLDVKSVLNDKSRWHPRWHLMSNEQ
jgi:hypothetical protein